MRLGLGLALTRGVRGTAFSPTSVSGLLAWYRFADGSGTTLTDAGPNGYHGTLVGSPTWGVTGGLTFTGTQRVTLPAATFATAKTVIFAAAQPASGNKILGGSNDAPGLLLLANAGVSTFNAGSGAVTTSAAVWYGDQMLTAVFDASADKLYYSDVELSYSVQGGSNGLVRTSPVIGNGAGSALPYGAAIYYALCYSAQLTALQIAQLRAYVQADLVAQSGLARRVLFDGNSLVSGSQNPTPADRFYDKTLALLNGSPDTANIATAGQPTSTIVLNTNAYPYYSIRRPRNVYLMWEITNDLAISSVSTATAYANVVTACSQQRNRGSKVVVLTCLPRPDAGNFTEANRQAVNALVRANWTTFADALADVGADPTIGAAGANLSATYYLGDNVHLGAAGNTVAAAIAAGAVNAVLA